MAVGKEIKTQIGSIKNTQKITGAMEQEPKRDKLGFIRSLLNLQISNFDYDKLFMTLKALN